MKEDYCTFFPEGLSKDVSWSHCCQAHDRAYEMQVDKGQADRDLYSCVKDSSNTFGIGLIAVLVFMGVVVFGRKFYKK